MNGHSYFFRSLSLLVLALPMGATAAHLLVPTLNLEQGESLALHQSPQGYQGYLHEDQLVSLTEPVYLTGFSLRLANGDAWRPAGDPGSSWPAVEIYFADYSVWMAPGSEAVTDIGEMPAGPRTFVDNMSGTPTQVRAGDLVIAANSFTADGGTNPGSVHSFGPLITFAVPYVYTPGQSLVYMIAHSGYGTSGTPGQPMFESSDYSGFAADAVHLSGSVDLSSTYSMYSSPFVLQFEYSAIPEPTLPMLLLGVTGFGLMLRRRARF
jgi:hypothetical protein